MAAIEVPFMIDNAEKLAKLVVPLSGSTEGKMDRVHCYLVFKKFDLNR